MRKINIISALLLVVLVITVFNSWFLSPILSAGDSWYYYSSMFDNHFVRPYAWYTNSIPTGLGGQGFAYMNTYIVVGLLLKIASFLNLGWENTSRILFNFSFLIAAISSSVFFVRKSFPKITTWVLAPIIFIFNSYLLMLVGGGLIIIALSYALIPFTFYLFMRLLETKDIKENSAIFTTIGFSFMLFAQCVLDLRIAFITFSAMLLYLVVSFFYRDLKIKNLLLVLGSLIFTALLNSYWLIPLFLFRINPIEQLGVNYSSSEIVKFLSFASFENALGLMHPYWPENIFGKIGFMKAEFLILPILAFSSLLFIKKEKEGKFVLFFILVALLGIFLGKGASEPFGNIYIWLFENVPGFQLFRDSFKWYVLIAFSYSVLIPFVVWRIYEWLQSQPKFQISSFKIQIKTKNKIFNFQNLFVFLVLAYLLFLIKPAILNQLGGTFVKRDVPAQYQELNNYLSSDNSFYRTFWVPNTMLFGYYSNNHPQISGRDFFTQYDQKKLLDEFSKESSRKQLDLSGVKYVIVPQDTEEQIYLTERKYDEKKYKYVVEKLNKIPWLTKEKEFGKIAVYKTQENKDHFWCDCDAKITWKFINPTKYVVTINGAKKGDKLIFSETFDDKWIAKGNNFSIKSLPYERKYNSFIIPEGNYELEVYYSPQKIVNSGVIINLISATVMVILVLFLVIKRKK